MKAKMEHAIDTIVKMAAEQQQPSAQVPTYNGTRPNNALSRSIRNEKEAEQFQAELKAVIDLAQNK
jgi:hypothetical protein